MKTTLTKEALIKMYNEMINETSGIIQIGYITFEPAQVLEECDTVAYRCGLNDYYDSICDDYYCEDME